MKIFVRQLPQVVTLNQLVADNPVIVLMGPAQLEVNWQLVQADPPSGNAKRNRTRTRNQGGLDPTTQTVVRRIELYNYTGIPVAMIRSPMKHSALIHFAMHRAPAN